MKPLLFMCHGGLPVCGGKHFASGIEGHTSWENPEESFEKSENDHR